MVKALGGAGLATLPVTRVKRRYTKSTLAAAGVAQEPGVKETTCMARVSPGARTEASVAPLKDVFGTTRSVVSTTNGLWFARVTVTGVPKSRLFPIRLLAGARARSFVTSCNSADDEAGSPITHS